ncbi:MAG TPA: UvrD-helicase domain-containing protein [Solirubrobacteraceae bacterium]
MHVSLDLQVRAVTGEAGPLDPLAAEPARAAAQGAAAPEGPAGPRARLTGEQELAVARRAEPLLLSAAAGSGKTSVLVERFVRAVREDGLAPGRILAITFTERAAGELRERVRARFLELGERDSARDTEAAFVGTFHGFCARLLRVHPLAAHLDPQFAILDEGLAGRLRRRAFSVALAEVLRGEGAEATVEVLAAYGVDRVQGMIASVHAQLRSRGERSPRLPGAGARASRREDGGEDAQPTEEARAREQLDAEATRVCALLDDLLAGYAGAYERLKRARAAVDFDDLELLARDLLEGDAGIREAWSARFELLMVDEFQDTNPRQLGILRALDRDNLFTVGDELQSIYGFRHADVRLFRARRLELAERGSALALTRNFRSRGALLDVVNAVFAPRFAGFTPLLAGREDVLVGAELEGGGEREGEQPSRVELLLTAREGWEQDEALAAEIAGGLPAAPLWRQAEARMLAQHVGDMVGAGRARAGEVVVLLRALGDLEVYERALQLRGLRTLAAVGGFWEHQQIGDLLAYLRALANPLDEFALYAALASPLGGVSRDGLALLALRSAERGAGAWETALAVVQEGPLAELAGADRAALARFCAGLAEERRQAPRHTLSQLIERVVGASGYAAHALTLDWGERRLANIHKLLRMARRFEAGEARDLRAFLDHVEHLIGAPGASESDAPVDGVEPDAVRLMSIHGAKGLEFPVVCVADLGRGGHTRLPELLLDGPRIGLQLVRLDGGKGRAALDYEQLAEERRRADAEEEDRILYVAMTRARERIVLSGAVDFEQWPEQRHGASMLSWLGPALSAELPDLARAGAAWHDVALAGAAAGAGSTTVHCRLNAPATIGAVMRRAPASTAALRDAGAPPSPPGPPAAAALPTGPPPTPALAAARARPTGPPPTPAVTAGVPAEQATATLSYTSLSELERCGYRYYLERVLGLKEDRAGARDPSSGAGGQARARGTLVHRLLESLDFAHPARPEHERVVALARELGMRLRAPEAEEIAGLIDAAARTPTAARVAAAREVRREHPFAFALEHGGPLVTGVVDLIAREQDGGCLVLDYKSDRVGAEADLEGLVEREYGIQRLLYALAMLREGFPGVEIVHWFLERPGEVVRARFLASERGTLESRLAARVARAREHGFAVSPRPHRGLCLTCPGRVALCSWSESETLREDPGGPREEAADIALQSP